MKTIIIDDEPWMLRHFSDVCTGVAEIELAASFRNPLAALEYARENPVELACVDVEMPRMLGTELATRLRELHPAAKLIFISAYDERDVQQLRELSDWVYLRKPYKREELQAAVDRVSPPHA